MQDGIIPQAGQEPAAPLTAMPAYAQAQALEQAAGSVQAMQEMLTGEAAYAPPVSDAQVQPQNVVLLPNLDEILKQGPQTLAPPPVPQPAVISGPEGYDKSVEALPPDAEDEYFEDDEEDDLFGDLPVVQPTRPLQRWFSDQEGYFCDKDVIGRHTFWLRDVDKADAAKVMTLPQQLAAKTGLPVESFTAKAGSANGAGSAGALGAEALSNLSPEAALDVVGIKDEVYDALITAGLVEWTLPRDVREPGAKTSLPPDVKERLFQKILSASLGGGSTDTFRQRRKRRAAR